MKKNDLGKKIIVVSLYQDVCYEVGNIINLFLDVKSDVYLIKENSDKIKESLYNLAHLKPTYVLVHQSRKFGIKTEKKQVCETYQYKKKMEEALSVLNNFPEFSEFKEKIKTYEFEDITISIIDSYIRSDEKFNSKKYVLTPVLREYGGAGCGGDCFKYGNAVSLDINKEDFEYLKSLKASKYKYGDEKATINELKINNYPKFINENIDNFFEEYSYGDEIYFILTECECEKI